MLVIKTSSISFIHSNHVDYKNSFLTNFQILNSDVLVSFIIFVADSHCKMNNEKFLCYFKKKENTSEDNEDITITNVVTSVVTKDITNAELSFAADEIKKITESS